MAAAAAAAAVYVVWVFRRPYHDPMAGNKLVRRACAGGRIRYWYWSRSSNGYTTYGDERLSAVTTKLCRSSQKKNLSSPCFRGPGPDVHRLLPGRDDNSHRINSQICLIMARPEHFPSPGDTPQSSNTQAPEALEPPKFHLVPRPPPTPVTDRHHPGPNRNIAPPLIPVYTTQHHPHTKYKAIRFRDYPTRCSLAR